jgi:hypothetical protein
LGNMIVEVCNMSIGYILMVVVVVLLIVWLLSLIL